PEQRELGERAPGAAERLGDEPLSRAEIELRERDADVGHGEPARSREEAVGAGPQLLADREPEAQRGSAEESGVRLNRPREGRVSRPARRAAKRPPEGAPPARRWLDRHRLVRRRRREAGRGGG